MIFYDLLSRKWSELIWCPILLTKTPLKFPLWRWRLAMAWHQWDSEAVICANRSVDAPLRVNGGDAKQRVCLEKMCPWSERYRRWSITGNFSAFLRRVFWHRMWRVKPEAASSFSEQIWFGNQNVAVLNCAWLMDTNKSMNSWQEYVASEEEEDPEVEFLMSLTTKQKQKLLR